MIKASVSPAARQPMVDIPRITEFILGVQKANGEIPWSVGGKTDPWDHVESAMGLTVGGCPDAARKAYVWSSETQLPDGSWWSYYRQGRPESGAYKDSNMTAYIAVGLFHYYLSTGDVDFVSRMYDTVRRAIDYVIGLQLPEGPIRWARRADGSVSDRALLTGSSSIYMSLGCALEIAALLGRREPSWSVARIRLGDAIRHSPWLFDQSKSRFSMDWYYPILCGAVIGDLAEERIDRHWSSFVVPGWGVRCVSDRPWATMAETAELSTALAAMGKMDLAEIALGWILDKKYPDGAFWTGVTFPDGMIYTAEKTAWTGAAALLAADLLYDLTPASRLFNHSDRMPLTLLQYAARDGGGRPGIDSGSETPRF